MRRLEQELTLQDDHLDPNFFLNSFPPLDNQEGKSHLSKPSSP